MLRPRIIPCLLVHKGGLVKTQGFKQPKYVGDPINAVRIFNEKEADELMVLDIDATRNDVAPDFDLIAKLAAECRMPMCYGGGVATAEQATRLVDMGVEKVAVSAAAITNPGLLSEMAQAVGRQSVVAVLDVRKRSGLFAKGFEVCTHNATVAHKPDPFTLAKQLQDAGAGADQDERARVAGHDARQCTTAVDAPRRACGRRPSSRREPRSGQSTARSRTNLR